MRVVTWNVNGIRSVLSKTKNGEKHSKPIKNNVVRVLLEELHPDVLCLQEVKCSPDVDVEQMLDLNGLGYNFCTMNCATVRKGYSGTCVISKIKPLEVIHGFGKFDTSINMNDEGRMITIEFESFFVINVYTPNSKADLSRLDFRTKVWDKRFREFVRKLQSRKHVIVCGDFNVAPEEIDVNNPKSAKGSHGFTLEERNSFGLLMTEANLVDTFREHNGSTVAYSWFSPFAKSREKNKGWRIDHILVSEAIKEEIVESKMYAEYFGSDHIPYCASLNI